MLKINHSKVPHIKNMRQFSLSIHGEHIENGELKKYYIVLRGGTQEMNFDQVNYVKETAFGFYFSIALVKYSSASAD